MRLGLSTLVFNIEETLNTCEKIKDISHIEVGIDNISDCQILLKYKERINNLNLSIGIHLPMELNTCESTRYINKSWAKFIECIEYELKDLDIKYFNLHLGYAIYDRLMKNRKKYIDISVGFLSQIISNIDTCISIENTYSTKGDLSNIGNKAYDFEYIFNKIQNEKLLFCYDTGHNLISKDDYINKLSNKIKIVHLSDNDGVKDLHIGIGEGILSKEEIKNILNLDIKYLILEIHPKYIKNSIKELRDIIKEI